MSKKNRVFVRRFTADELSSMSDDELRDKIVFFTNTVENPPPRRGDSEQAAWETELAYLQREAASRKARYEIHENYMRELHEQERKFEQEEASLPVVNFDNFVAGRNHA